MKTSDSAPQPPSSRKLPFWRILLVLLLLALALFGDKGIMRAIQSRRQKEALQQEVNRLEATNEALRKEIHALRSDRRYIEDIARRELGMVKKDELVFQFSNKKTKKKENGKGTAPKKTPQVSGK
ncbi:MAG: septum formation initiator family protein [Desulfuromonadales bacterium]|jgi:cell division protein FtsB